MKHSVCIAAAVLVLAASVMAQENRRDGNWWNTETPLEKATYVIGFFDGIHLGNEFSYWKCLTDKDEVCQSKVMDSFDYHQHKFMAHLTSGQVTDGLDDFYKDFRNRKILTQNATWLVLNEISGMPNAQFEKMVNSFRANADID